MGDLQQPGGAPGLALGPNRDAWREIRNQINGGLLGSCRAAPESSKGGCLQQPPRLPPPPRLQPPLRRTAHACTLARSHACADNEQKLLELQFDYQQKVNVNEALKLELRQMLQGAPPAHVACHGVHACTGCAPRVPLPYACRRLCCCLRRHRHARLRGARRPQQPRLLFRLKTSQGALAAAAGHARAHAQAAARRMRPGFTACMHARQQGCPRMPRVAVCLRARAAGNLAAAARMLPPPACTAAARRPGQELEQQLAALQHDAQLLTRQLLGEEQELAADAAKLAETR